MIKAQDLLQRLSEILTDEGLDFWTKAYQAKSINEAVRAIIKLKPEASYRRDVVTVDSNALQHLPDNAFKLLDIEGTVGDDGQVKCSIKSNSINELNRQEPTWRHSEPSNAIEFFMYEDLKPRDYWLYPRPNAGIKLSLVYSYIPTAITKETEWLDMRPEYENDIINFCLWRAWQREGTEQKILSARQIFHEELGIAEQADDARHPQDNRKRDERNHNYR